MSILVMYCFMIVFLVVLCEGQNQCGQSKCSEAQICDHGKCVCTPIRCLMLCPLGFKRDENGCEYPCTCAEEDENLPQKQCGSKCSPAQVCKDGGCVCTPIRCRIICPSGFKRDENGCEYPCTCAGDESPPQKPCGHTYCTEGQVCEEGKCVCTEIRCAIECLFGFKVDENGCEYPCTCAEKPQYS